jgi:hypothetical protein
MGASQMMDEKKVSLTVVWGIAGFHRVDIVCRISYASTSS